MKRYISYYYAVLFTKYVSRMYFVTVTKSLF